MRAVLDTNVVVSATMTPHGKCAQCLQLALQGDCLLFADERIFEEYETVLRRPELGISESDAAPLLDAIRSEAQSIVPLPLAASLPDPSDLPVLEVAAAAEAVLVTGNSRHYPIVSRAGVTVLSPADFLDRLRGIRSRRRD